MSSLVNTTTWQEFETDDLYTIQEELVKIATLEDRLRSLKVKGDDNIKNRHNEIINLLSKIINNYAKYTKPK